MDCEKPNARIFDAALRALGVENREHVLMVGDSLASDIQGRHATPGWIPAGITLNHAENPGKADPHLRDRQSGGAVSAGDGAGGTGQRWPEEAAATSAETNGVTEKNG
ncbi:MAG: HAD-IA family hydrolase [Faecalibacterium sp.]